MAKAPTAGSLHWINPADLIISEQPRTEVNEKADRELCASIKLYGVREPVLGHWEGEKPMLDAGHRRTAQAIVAEVPLIPVFMTEMADGERIAIQMIENIQRLDMSLADTSNGVWALYDGPAGGVASVVAEMLGKSKPWVSKMLLLAAPGRSHTVARKLMAQDKLHDLEMAYTICRIEELSKGAANDIAENIATETRASLQKVLKSLMADKPDAGDDADPDDEGQDSLDKPTEDDTVVPVVIDLELLRFMLATIADATVAVGKLTMKANAIRVLTEAVALHPDSAE